MIYFLDLRFMVYFLDLRFMIYDCRLRGLLGHLLENWKLKKKEVCPYQIVIYMSIFQSNNQSFVDNTLKMLTKCRQYISCDNKQHNIGHGLVE